MCVCLCMCGVCVCVCVCVCVFLCVCVHACVPACMPACMRVYLLSAHKQLPSPAVPYLYPETNAIVLTEVVDVALRAWQVGAELPVHQQFGLVA